MPQYDDVPIDMPQNLRPPEAPKAGHSKLVLWGGIGLAAGASLLAARALANALAAEHVQIATDDPEALFRQIRHAGSVFLGRMTPEAVGDYVAGPNHVLPTGRRARFSSGLSVLDFMKRTSFIQLDEKALRKVGPAAIELADAEGLTAHARSIEVRLGI